MKNIHIFQTFATFFQKRGNVFIDLCMIKYLQDLEDYRKLKLKANYKIKCFLYLKWKLIYCFLSKVVISMKDESKLRLSYRNHMRCNSKLKSNGKMVRFRINVFTCQKKKFASFQNPFKAKVICNISIFISCCEMKIGDIIQIYFV